jgi:hypothetical protein
MAVAGVAPKEVRHEPALTGLLALSRSRSLVGSRSQGKVRAGSDPARRRRHFFFDACFLAWARSEAATDFTFFGVFGLLRSFEANEASFLLVAMTTIL